MIKIQSEADIPRDALPCACGQATTLKGLVDVDRRPPLTLYYSPMCEGCYDAFGYTSGRPYLAAGDVFAAVEEEAVWAAEAVVTEAFANPDPDLEDEGEEESSPRPAGRPVINEASMTARLLVRLRERLAPGQMAGDNITAEEAIDNAVDVLMTAAQAQADREYPPAGRRRRKSWLQSLQNGIGNLQHSYRDTQAEFWAGLVAWEAARFFWYVVAGDVDTAREKLVLVDEAIGHFRSFDKKKGG